MDKQLLHRIYADAKFVRHHAIVTRSICGSVILIDKYADNIGSDDKAIVLQGEEATYFLAEAARLCADLAIKNSYTCWLYLARKHIKSFWKK